MVRQKVGQYSLIDLLYTHRLSSHLKEEIIMQVDERLDRLEIKLAYIEDFVERLQAVVVEQNRLAEKLQQEHRVLKDKILLLTKELEEIPNRKPPHY
ncbi:SlyX family protein [Gracilinema caldarium]|nr:SlyX family protein [Gracilinema caldarium]